MAKSSILPVQKQSQFKANPASFAASPGQVQSQFTPSARLGAKRSIKKVRQFFGIVYNANFYTALANV